MKTFTHVLYTWLLAHAFHIVLFSLTDYITSVYFDPGVIGIVLMVGPIVSVPALLISWVFFQLLFTFQSSSCTKMGIWFLLIALSLIINLFLLLPNRFFSNITDSLLFLTPALIAGLIAIIVRRHLFESVFTPKSIDNETYLV